MNKLSKAILIALYVATLLSLFVPALAPYSQTLLIISGALLVAHVGEYLWVRDRLAGVEGNHFLQTLLFGFVHWLPIIRQKAQR